MRDVKIIKTIEIPENVKLLINGRNVIVKGDKGELYRNFSHAPVLIKVDGKILSQSHQRRII